MEGGLRTGEKAVGDYVALQQIGSGSFSVVWRGVHRSTGEEVAIKEVPTEKLSGKLQESLESEISILGNANHPNIVRLLDIVKTPERIFLIMEHCAGGDLSSYIRKTGPVDELTAQHFMRQLGQGLQVLRANNLIHRDLKPQNLLLSERSASASIKIADFGFARSLQPQGLAETLCGSPLYMAPEILQCQKYDAKADLWSVGAILFELVTGKPPFGGQNHVHLLQNIKKSEAVVPPEVAQRLSSSCRGLIGCLLKRNPVERLSFEEFFNHPFLGLSSCPLEGLEEPVVRRAQSQQGLVTPPGEAGPPQGARGMATGGTAPSTTPNRPQGEGAGLLAGGLTVPAGAGPGAGAGNLARAGGGAGTGNVLVQGSEGGSREEDVGSAGMVRGATAGGTDGAGRAGGKGMGRGEIAGGERGGVGVGAGVGEGDGVGGAHHATSTEGVRVHHSPRGTTAHTSPAPSHALSAPSTAPSSAPLPAPSAARSDTLAALLPTDSRGGHPQGVPLAYTGMDVVPQVPIPAHLQQGQDKRAERAPGRVGEGGYSGGRTLEGAQERDGLGGPQGGMPAAYPGAPEGAPPGRSGGFQGAVYQGHSQGHTQGVAAGGGHGHPGGSDGALSPSADGGGAGGFQGAAYQGQAGHAEKRGGRGEQEHAGATSLEGNNPSCSGESRGSALDSMEMLEREYVVVDPPSETASPQHIFRMSPSPSSSPGRGYRPSKGALDPSYSPQRYFPSPSPSSSPNHAGSGRGGERDRGGGGGAAGAFRAQGEQALAQDPFPSASPSPSSSPTPGHAAARGGGRERERGAPHAHERVPSHEGDPFGASPSPSSSPSHAMGGRGRGSRGRAPSHDPFGPSPSPSSSPSHCPDALSSSLSSSLPSSQEGAAGSQQRALSQERAAPSQDFAAPGAGATLGAGAGAGAHFTGAETGTGAGAFPPDSSERPALGMGPPPSSKQPGPHSVPGTTPASLPSAQERALHMVPGATSTQAGIAGAYQAGAAGGYQAGSLGANQGRTQAVFQVGFQPGTTPSTQSGFHYRPAAGPFPPTKPQRPASGVPSQGPASGAPNQGLAAGVGVGTSDFPGHLATSSQALASAGSGGESATSHPVPGPTGGVPPAPQAGGLPPNLRPEPASAAAHVSAAAAAPREEAPAEHPSARLARLRAYGKCISDLAARKFEAGWHHEAFSLHLLCLIIWREALRVSHAWAADPLDSADPPPTSSNSNPSNPSSAADHSPSHRAQMQPQAATWCDEVEGEYLSVVAKAEAAALKLHKQDPHPVPDAAESVYQAALSLGRAGAVEELMGKTVAAESSYSRAASLLHFLLLEAPLLPLSPPLPGLAHEERQRLQRYADSIAARRTHCRLELSPLG